MCTLGDFMKREVIVCILGEFNLHIKLGLKILVKMVVKCNYCFARCRNFTQLLDDNWVSFYFFLCGCVGG